MFNRLSPKLFFPAAILWLIIVTILLCMPGSEFPKVTWMTKIWFDKWVHIFLFFFLTILWCLAISDRIHLKRKQSVFIRISVLCILYGIVMEIVQHFFVMYRGFEIGDVVADGLGSLGGYFYSLKK